MMNATAVVLPWVEFVCGLVPIAGVAIRAAGVVLVAMLVMFTRSRRFCLSRVWDRRSFAVVATGAVSGC